MNRIVLRSFVVCLLVLLLQASSYALPLSPLEPPDTSSPRGTLESFMEATDDLSDALQDEDVDRDTVWQHWNRAIRCFNLSQVPPTIVEDVALESVLRLREILDRIELPAMETVPNKDTAKHYGTMIWRLPHTEISIGKVTQGEYAGEFLFTPNTVDRLDDYYDAVRDLPYRDGETQGLYEDYIYASGWMIPDGFIGDLPGWMRDNYVGQALWKWVGFALVVSLISVLLWGVYIVSAAWRAKRCKKGWPVERLFTPLLGMGGCTLIEYLLKAQINITGKVLSVSCFVLEGMFLIFATWAIIVFGNIVIYRIIASRHIKEEALDADVIKLIGRLVAFCLVFVLFFYAGRHFGLPVTAVFASAGIVGMAVALAARETLSNFFGGVSIFLDRPFKAGDYIVLETGERGEVKTVGMRSTRIQTRDDILITIPNSIITSVKIVNQSAPHPHFRVRIPVGVAYGTDIDEVEKVLISVGETHEAVMDSPVPRVRLRSFGDSSINIELLVWAIQPRDRGRLIHELSKLIVRRFEEEGIVIPFPQRDVHIMSQEAK